MTMYAALTTLMGAERAQALAEAVEEALEPFGVGHFEVEDGSGLFEVGCHFEERPDGVALDLLAAVHGAKPFLVSEVPDVDWVAKVRRDLPPVVAGRFVVHGAHSAGELPGGKLPLLVEAAMAFGTGHHATTLGCLLALDRLEAEGFAPARVADVGAGTAVLAMAAALLWPEAEVVAGDNDPVAVETARANLVANGLGRVAAVEAEGVAHERLAGPFDLVVANILKGPLIGMAPDLAGVLAPGGRVILSGILATQADEVAATYADLGINEARRDVIGDWAALILTQGEP